eukprot:TRINITY_DN65044_c0_g1_i1.p2 TRINITY_DN65044_c0_g1~~TRINITY_DN65044_c0_g1_i1.p2  ORF type:complete len:387 (+),score=180.79 TRINITY_DN65044_c0_g1_i1:84-1244(+)
MGIHGLTKLLTEKAPQCFKEDQMKNYFGRTIAIDASMSIYQFLIAMKGVYEGAGTELQDEDGNVTSHLQGLFTRTLRMISEGLKPIYVFDGKPPEMKRKELEERRQKAEEARAALAAAEEQGDEEQIEKMGKRTVRVTKEQNEECKRLLRLMGLPVVDAATEAEAQCAELVRAGKAWAVGTEDMDALTFGAKVLLRHLNFSEAKKAPILEFHHDAVLEGLGMTRAQFVDLCILLGCDYCPRIPGVGPKKAYDGIKQYGTIEKFVESLNREKYKVPEHLPYEEVRKLFQEPEVFPSEEVAIEFRDPDAEGLIQFLCDEKKFSRSRVEAGIEKLRKARQQKEQKRLDQFFSIAPKLGAPKRKADDKGKPLQGSGKIQKGAGGKKAVKR